LFKLIDLPSSMFSIRNYLKIFHIIAPLLHMFYFHMLRPF
jgi:hypothetical protein